MFIFQIFDFLVTLPCSLIYVDDSTCYERSKFSDVKCWLQRKNICSKSRFQLILCKYLIASFGPVEFGLFSLNFLLSLVLPLCWLFSFTTAALNWKQSILNWLQDPFDIQVKINTPNRCEASRFMEFCVIGNFIAEKQTYTRNWSFPLSGVEIFSVVSENAKQCRKFRTFRSNVTQPHLPKYRHSLQASFLLWLFTLWQINKMFADSQEFLTRLNMILERSSFFTFQLQVFSFGRLTSESSSPNS